MSATAPAAGSVTGEAPVSSAEATAPARVDLAGGTLDIWPLYLFHPGATTVNVAIDRRAWCRVERIGAGVEVESKDTRQKAEAGSVAELLEQGTLRLVTEILRAFGVESGMRVATKSGVPAGSGLGGSSALAVAVGGALARVLGRELGPDALCALVRDAEARAIGVPTGVQDYYAAIHGNVLALEMEPGAIRVRRLKTDPGRIEESLVLVLPGGTRFSGLNNWEVFKGQIDGSGDVRGRLAQIAGVGAAVRDALEQGRYGEVGALIDREWQARAGLAPEVTTPEIDRLAALAAEAGGAAKVCGAGGGGVMALWAPPGERGPGARERLEEALKAAGLRPMPYRVDLRGLVVS